MNRAELTRKMAVDGNITLAEATAALDAFCSAVTEALVAGDVVNLQGFANIKVVEKAERNGRNPSTGESIVIPAKKAVKFKTSGLLAAAVNAPKKKRRSAK